MRLPLRSQPTTRLAPPPKKPATSPPVAARVMTSMSLPSSLRGISKYTRSPMRGVLNRPVRVRASDVMTRAYGRGAAAAGRAPPVVSCGVPAGRSAAAVGGAPPPAGRVGVGAGLRAGSLREHDANMTTARSGYQILL